MVRTCSCPGEEVEIESGIVPLPWLHLAYLGSGMGLSGVLIYDVGRPIGDFPLCQGQIIHWGTFRMMT